MPAKKKKSITPRENKSREVSAPLPEQQVIKLSKQYAKQHGLSDEQYMFAINYMKTYSAREAIVATLGDHKLSDKALRMRADQLINSPKVRAFINRRLQEFGEEIGIDKKFLMLGILQNRELARDKGDAATALKADELLGKLMGILVEKREVAYKPINEMSLEEVEIMLEGIDITDKAPSQELEIPQIPKPEKPKLTKRITKKAAKLKEAAENESED